jgi:hypothetical protein
MWTSKETRLYGDVPLTGWKGLEMERYVVTQEHEELWWVSHQDAKLYCYSTEAEARLAALALARDATQGGAQATVLVMPSSTEVEVHDTRPLRRFSGM